MLTELDVTFGHHKNSIPQEPQLLLGLFIVFGRPLLNVFLSLAWYIAICTIWAFISKSLRRQSFLSDLSPPPIASFLPFTKQCLVNELLFCQRIKHLMSLLFFELHAFNGQVLCRELFCVFDAIFMAVRVFKGLFRLRAFFFFSKAFLPSLSWVVSLFLFWFSPSTKFSSLRAPPL